MPDLTGLDVGGNYRRALDNFSRFGTRKLAFYTIEIGGLDQSVIDTLYNETESDPEWPQEWLEQPGSILEAVQRGVQLLAEPYYYSDWDWDNDGSYYYLYLTMIVAADTVEDSVEQSDHNANPNSIGFEQAIGSAIDNFNYDYVYVQQADLAGDYLYGGGSDAVPRNTPESVARHTTNRTARLAAGKTGFKKHS